MAKIIKKSSEEGKQIIIPALKIQPLEIKLVCYAPGDELIVHAWSEKAKKEMLAKQKKEAKQGKEPKDPDRDYRESLYWLESTGKVATKKGETNYYDVQRISVQDVDPAKHNLFGFKTIAFKAAAVKAANDVGIPMTVTRRAFHVNGEFVQIHYDKVYMREDMVRLNGGVADLRYRGAFVNWWVLIQVELNIGVMSSEQLVNLFNTAGFGVGVGEWRPERNGVSGRFKVA